VRFAFIGAEQARHAVAILCRCLRVTRSGFYAWRHPPSSQHTVRDQQLRALIRSAYDASRGRYGSPRVREDLRAHGIAISRKRVARLMRVGGLRARARKRFRVTTMSEHDQPIAANVVARQFVADRPNQRWVGDTTEFVIGSGAKLYLAAILDLYSRSSSGGRSVPSTIGMSPCVPWRWP
jgi:putative transposase